MSLNILLLGSGGREHALAWKLAQSPKVNCIYAVPGNGGTCLVSKVTNVPSVNPSDFAAVLAFAVDNQVELVVPGPEEYLCKGVVDYFQAHGPARIRCFGPTQKAAALEGSKMYAKETMRRYGIPTARFENFSVVEKAKKFLEAKQETKWVIKADGLAAGKGVRVTQNHSEAVSALEALSTEFGTSGLVVEEFLEGEELSVLSFVDGYTIRSLPGAQDFKRVNDDINALMTGGMGCLGNAPIATPKLLARIHDDVLEPVVSGLRRDASTPFCGMLFTGLMIRKDGSPACLEWNVRFGDPECQTLLPLLDADLVDIMLACTNHTLDSIELKVKPGFTTTVVAAAGGYPGKYAKNIPMTVLPPPPGTYHFHAGTSMNAFSKTFKTNGGRVIAATALSPTLQGAVDEAYAAIKRINFESMYYRHDIGRKAVEQQKQAEHHSSSDPLTYHSAGVSIADGNSLVQRIKPYLQSTSRPGSDAAIGGFGGIFSLPAAGYSRDSPTLVAAIDGIGTKVMLAQAMGDYTTVGIDLVAMNVNDLVVQGAEPLCFLDYYATGKLIVDQAAAFVEGVANGCRQCRCALIGGETAEMPGVYSKTVFDAAGCAIGALKPGQSALPLKESMKRGDVLLGFGSSGPHSNGFSMIRKIIERSGIQCSDPCPWNPRKTLGTALLEPTRIYVNSLLNVLGMSRGEPLIKGIAHVTGGGLLENIPRMLPKELSASLDASTWPVPPSLRWLKRMGQVEDIEFAKVFNTGIGMVVVVDRADSNRVAEVLKSSGEDVYQIGELQTRREQEVVLERMEVWGV